MKARPRLLRFRLRTILIAMVVIGLVLSRCEFRQIREPSQSWLFGLHGTRRAMVFVVLKTERPRVTFHYTDRVGWGHTLSALFAFDTCPCHGYSLKWDGERYVGD